MEIAAALILLLTCAALAIALVVTVTARRTDASVVEELRIAHEALAERLEAALREIEALTRLLRGHDD